MRTAQDRKSGPTVAWLLDQIEAFLTLNEMDNDGLTFGWYVAKDRSLVPRLRAGGDVVTTKMDDILAFMQCPVTKTKDLKPLTIQPKELPHER